jgi:hypothetical protein
MRYALNIATQRAGCSAHNCLADAEQQNAKPQRR